MPDKPEREIARIAETIVLPWVGNVALVILILSYAVALGGFVMAGTAQDRIAAMVFWIGSTLMWGGTAAVSRRRVYRVLKTEPE